jgi:hypothetical protein
MQVITQAGFTSAVAKDDSGRLEIRARDKQSLEDWCRRAKVSQDRIIEGGGTDYAFRVRAVTKRELKRYYSSHVDDITYSNFKDRIKETRGKKWGKALMDVWVALYALQTSKVYDRPLSIGKAYTSSSGARNGRWADDLSWIGRDDREWPTADEIHRLSDGDYNRVYDALDQQAKAGDGDADALLNEVDRLWENERDGVFDTSEIEALMQTPPPF